MVLISGKNNSGDHISGCISDEMKKKKKFHTRCIWKRLKVSWWFHPLNLLYTLDEGETGWVRTVGTWKMLNWVQLGLYLKIIFIIDFFFSNRNSKMWAKRRLLGGLLEPLEHTSLLLRESLRGLREETSTSISVFKCSRCLMLLVSNRDEEWDRN